MRDVPSALVVEPAGGSGPAGGADAGGRSGSGGDALVHAAADAVGGVDGAAATSGEGSTGGSADAPADERPMVVFDGVGKDYGTVAALRELTLTVRPGEVFGFLGPNGAGKTTTIRILTGLTLPSRGRVVVDGVSLADEPDRVKRTIGYVADEPYLYQKLTGDEYVAFVGGLWGLSREESLERAAPFFGLFSLDAVRTELVEGYSHGMKQKLVLTATLLHDPRLLVVDEPTVGLDPRSVGVMKRLFRERAAAGATVFLSTHSLDVAETTCDRIGILHRGRLVALGTMADLRERARSDGGSLETVFLTLTEEEGDEKRG